MPAKSRAASPQDTSDFEQVEVMSSDYEEPPKARGRGRGRARGRGRGAGRGCGKAAPFTPSTTRTRKTPKSKEYIDSDDDAETGAVDSEAEEVGAAQIEKEERCASFEAEREEEEIEGDDVQSDDGFTVVKTKSTARRSRSSPGRVLVPDSDEEVTKKACYGFKQGRFVFTPLFVQLLFFIELNYRHLKRFSAQAWNLASAGSETFIVALKEEEGLLGIEALCRDSAGFLLIEDAWRAQMSASACAVLFARGQI
ncbi:hypothetical protein BXZ70DRAFT_908397 [Cristinia sonorae]|uniref:Uncharacterized protein n=1 Tax=Cristinia sonorae TaxID=1940300 RepID=A0A8K0XNE8_9AGAR|nr:hypothetical protein BXZ70DRAFT_908397 [Cristinia sonorae]